MTVERAIGPVLEFTNLSKTFGPTKALSNVDFDVRPGEIHGLVGRNGSGKSTLIKVLSGFHDPDRGTQLKLRGEDVELPLRGNDAAQLGMVFVHQDLGLVPAFSILENLRLGTWRRRGFSKIPWADEKSAVAYQLSQFGLKWDPLTPVGALPPVDRAIVAIARAIREIATNPEGHVLVLDEPTAYLPSESVDKLFDAVKKVTRQGTGVVFISHRTDEILNLTDRISVLRDGRKVATVNTRETKEADLVSMILGQSMNAFYPDHVPSPSKEVVLSTKNMAAGSIPKLNITLRRGEVLGLTGLMGAGHDQVPYALFGALEHSDGTITIKNKKYEKEELNPRKAVSQGVALLPGDRTGASGVLLATLTDNVGMPVLRKYFNGGLLRRGKLKKDVGELLRRFDVNPPVPGIELRKLSGGNQQKALLAKWIQIKPDVLLLHEPTQGVDVGSKAAIFSKISDAARAGAGVIVASAEHEDLANICNRVLIFADGKVVAELVDRELTPEKIVELSYLGTRKGGGIKRGFVWRPHMNGLKGPYLHVTRNYTWSPHKVGFKTHIEWPAPAKPAVQYEKQEATFVWSPHTVGFVKREYRWFPHTVGMQNTVMPYPGPRIVKVEREFNLIPTGELSSFFVWRPHYVGNNEPVYLGPKDVDKWKTELSASLAAMVARGEITATVAEKMAKAAGVTLGKSQDLRVTIELDVRTRNKGNVADVDRFKHALLNMDQSLLDVNGVRILGIELQPDKTR